MGEDNIKNSVKHDIKTSFLIANSFNALIGGLFPLSVATGVILSEGFIPPVLYSMAVGIPTAAFVSLGFYAAFNENKKMLNIYSVLMCLVMAKETLTVAAVMGPSIIGDDMFVVNFLILHTGITLAAMTLAMCLAKQIPSVETPKSSNSGLGQCLKYFGCGVLGVLIVGCIANYFVV